MCAAVVCFSLLDAVAKFLTADGLPALQVVWGRYFGHLAFALLALRPWARTEMLHSNAHGLEVVRGFLLLGTTALNFMALRWLALTETTSIMFAGPLVVAALAGPLLGEWIGPRRWIAVFVGFVGVVIVARPEAGLHPAMLLSVASMVCYALYAITTRQLSHTDAASTMLLYSAVVAVIAITPVMPFIWVMPTPTQVAFMTSTGALGAVGHFMLIRAHRLAPASILSPFIYTQMIWMTGLGFVVFDNLPGLNVAVGSAVIVGSGLYLLWREHATRMG